MLRPRVNTDVVPSPIVFEYFMGISPSQSTGDIKAIQALLFCSLNNPVCKIVPCVVPCVVPWPISKLKFYPAKQLVSS